MKTREILTHPATIIIGSILLLWGLYAIGQKYWGWGQDVPANEEGAFDANGNPINTSAGSKQKGCSPECLEAYPVGSKYYGYYRCKSNCAPFERQTQPVLYNSYVQTTFVPRTVITPRPNVQTDGVR